MQNFMLTIALGISMKTSDMLLQGKNPNRSVRAPHGSRPIELSGQDESVFSQFIIPTKSWIGTFPQVPPRGTHDICICFTGLWIRNAGI